MDFMVVRQYYGLVGCDIFYPVRDLPAFREKKFGVGNI
jgi:hypothetical protein